MEYAASSVEPAQPLEIALCLGSGVVAALVLSALLPASFAWFLCAIPHEMGHATAGSLLGMPSAPAISLRGEAWTGHGEFRSWLAIASTLALAALAFALRHRRGSLVALSVAAVAVPLLAFGAGAETLTIAAGHLGELAFAGYCYSLVVSGGRTGQRAERIAAAAAAMIVQLRNLRLTFGLMTSAVARQEYASNGSLGLKNDYLRLAEDVFACRLETVAVLMLLLGALALPLGLLVGWLHRSDA